MEHFIPIERILQKMCYDSFISPSPLFFIFLLTRNSRLSRIIYLRRELAYVPMLLRDDTKLLHQRLEHRARATGESHINVASTSCSILRNKGHNIPLTWAITASASTIFSNLNLLVCVDTFRLDLLRESRSKKN